MKSNLDHIIEWGAVVLFIGVLIYTMIVVKEEKVSFQRECNTLTTGIATAFIVQVGGLMSLKIVTMF